MDTQHFKDLLEKKAARIEGELKTVGQKIGPHATDWEGVETDAANVDRAEDGEVADGLEQLDNNSAIVDQLEKQLADVKSALEKIEAGTYGICQVCNEPIEFDRLEVNPSSLTCKAHME
jgi:RNA polymerase-binding transcription factor DksA